MRVGLEGQLCNTWVSLCWRKGRPLRITLSELVSFPWRQQQHGLKLVQQTPYLWVTVKPQNTLTELLVTVIRNLQGITCLVLISWQHQWTASGFEQSNNQRGQIDWSNEKGAFKAYWLWFRCQKELSENIVYGLFNLLRILLLLKLKTYNQRVWSDSFYCVL